MFCRLDREIEVRAHDTHRVNFELFKSNACHRLKELGDIDFVIELLKKILFVENINK